MTGQQIYEWLKANWSKRGETVMYLHSMSRGGYRIHWGSSGFNDAVVF